MQASMSEVVLPLEGRDDGEVHQTENNVGLSVPLDPSGYNYGHSSSHNCKDKDDDIIDRTLGLIFGDEAAQNQLHSTHPNVGFVRDDVPVEQEALKSAEPKNYVLDSTEPYANWDEGYSDFNTYFQTYAQKHNASGTHSPPVNEKGLCERLGSHDYSLDVLPVLIQEKLVQGYSFEESLNPLVSAPNGNSLQEEYFDEISADLKDCKSFYESQSTEISSEGSPEDVSPSSNSMHTVPLSDGMMDVVTPSPTEEYGSPVGMDAGVGKNVIIEMSQVSSPDVARVPTSDHIVCQPMSPPSYRQSLSYLSSECCGPFGAVVANKIVLPYSGEGVLSENDSIDSLDYGPPKLDPEDDCQNCVIDQPSEFPPMLTPADTIITSTSKVTVQAIPSAAGEDLVAAKKLSLGVVPETSQEVAEMNSPDELNVSLGKIVPSITADISNQIPTGYIMNDVYNIRNVTPDTSSIAVGPPGSGSLPVLLPTADESKSFRVISRSSRSKKSQFSSDIRALTRFDTKEAELRKKARELLKSNPNKLEGHEKVSVKIALENFPTFPSRIPGSLMVQGQKVGESSNGQTPAATDITKQLKRVTLRPIIVIKDKNVILQPNTVRKILAVTSKPVVSTESSSSVALRQGISTTPVPLNRLAVEPKAPAKEKTINSKPNPTSNPSKVPLKQGLKVSLPLNLLSVKPLTNTENQKTVKTPEKERPVDNFEVNKLDQNEILSTLKVSVPFLLPVTKPEVSPSKVKTAGEVVGKSKKVSETRPAPVAVKISNKDISVEGQKRPNGGGVSMAVRAVKPFIVREADPELSAYKPSSNDVHEPKEGTTPVNDKCQEKGLNGKEASTANEVSILQELPTSVVESKAIEPFEPKDLVAVPTSCNEKAVDLFEEFATKNEIISNKQKDVKERLLSHIVKKLETLTEDGKVDVLCLKSPIEVSQLGGMNEDLATKVGTEVDDSSLTLPNPLKVIDRYDVTLLPPSNEKLSVSEQSEANLKRNGDVSKASEINPRKPENKSSFSDISADSKTFSDTSDALGGDCPNDEVKVHPVLEQLVIEMIESSRSPQVVVEPEKQDLEEQPFNVHPEVVTQDISERVTEETIGVGEAQNSTLADVISVADVGVSASEMADADITCEKINSVAPVVPQPDEKVEVVKADSLGKLENAKITGDMSENEVKIADNSSPPESITRDEEAGVEVETSRPIIEPASEKVETVIKNYDKAVAQPQSPKSSNVVTAEESIAEMTVIQPGTKPVKCKKDDPKKRNDMLAAIVTERTSKIMQNARVLASSSEAQNCTECANPVREKLDDLSSKTDQSFSLALAKSEDILSDVAKHDHLISSSPSVEHGKRPRTRSETSNEKKMLDNTGPDQIEKPDPGMEKPENKAESFPLEDEESSSNKVPSSSIAKKAIVGINAAKTPKDDQPSPQKGLKVSSNHITPIVAVPSPRTRGKIERKPATVKTIPATPKKGGFKVVGLSSTTKEDCKKDESDSEYEPCIDLTSTDVTVEVDGSSWAETAEPTGRKIGSKGISGGRRSVTKRRHSSAAIAPKLEVKVVRASVAGKASGAKTTSMRKKIGNARVKKSGRGGVRTKQKKMIRTNSLDKMSTNDVYDFTDDEEDQTVKLHTIDHFRKVSGKTTNKRPSLYGPFTDTVSRHLDMCKNSPAGRITRSESTKTSNCKEKQSPVRQSLSETRRVTKGVDNEDITRQEQENGKVSRSESLKLSKKLNKSPVRKPSVWTVKRVSTDELVSPNPAEEDLLQNKTPDVAREDKQLGKLSVKNSEKTRMKEQQGKSDICSSPLREPAKIINVQDVSIDCRSIRSTRRSKSKETIAVQQINNRENNVVVTSKNLSEEKTAQALKKVEDVPVDSRSIRKTRRSKSKEAIADEEIGTLENNEVVTSKNFPEERAARASKKSEDSSVDSTQHIMSTQQSKSKEAITSKPTNNLEKDEGVTSKNLPEERAARASKKFDDSSINSVCFMSTRRSKSKEGVTGDQVNNPENNEVVTSKNLPEERSARASKKCEDSSVDSTQSIMSTRRSKSKEGISDKLINNLEKYEGVISKHLPEERAAGASKKIEDSSLDSSCIMSTRRSKSKEAVTDKQEKNLENNELVSSKNLPEERSARASKKCEDSSFDSTQSIMSTRRSKSKEAIADKPVNNFEKHEGVISKNLPEERAARASKKVEDFSIDSRSIVSTRRSKSKEAFTDKQVNNLENNEVVSSKNLPGEREAGASKKIEDSSVDIRSIMSIRRSKSKEAITNKQINNTEKDEGVVSKNLPEESAAQASKKIKDVSVDSKSIKSTRRPKSKDFITDQQTDNIENNELVTSKALPEERKARASRRSKSKDNEMDECTKQQGNDEGSIIWPAAVALRNSRRSKSKEVVASLPKPLVSADFKDDNGTLHKNKVGSVPQQTISKEIDAIQKERHHECSDIAKSSQVLAIRSSERVKNKEGNAGQMRPCESRAVSVRSKSEEGVKFISKVKELENTLDVTCVQPAPIRNSRKSKTKEEVPFQKSNHDSEDCIKDVHKAQTKKGDCVEGGAHVVTKKAMSNEVEASQKGMVPHYDVGESRILPSTDDRALRASQRLKSKDGDTDLKGKPNENESISDHLSRVLRNKGLQQSGNPVAHTILSAEDNPTPKKEGKKAFEVKPLDSMNSIKPKGENNNHKSALEHLAPAVSGDPICTKQTNDTVTEAVVPAKDQEEVTDGSASNCMMTRSSSGTNLISPRRLSKDPNHKNTPPKETRCNKSSPNSEDGPILPKLRSSAAKKLTGVKSLSNIAENQNASSMPEFSSSLLDEKSALYEMAVECGNGTVVADSGRNVKKARKIELAAMPKDSIGSIKTDGGSPPKVIVLSLDSVSEPYAKDKIKRAKRNALPEGVNPPALLSQESAPCNAEAVSLKTPLMDSAGVQELESIQMVGEMTQHGEPEGASSSTHFAQLRSLLPPEDVEVRNPVLQRKKNKKSVALDRKNLATEKLNCEDRDHIISNTVKSKQERLHSILDPLRNAKNQKMVEAMSCKVVGSAKTRDGPSKVTKGESLKLITSADSTPMEESQNRRITRSSLSGSSQNLTLEPVQQHVEEVSSPKSRRGTEGALTNHKIVHLKKDGASSDAGVSKYDAKSCVVSAQVETHSNPGKDPCAKESVVCKETIEPSSDMKEGVTVKLPTRKSTRKTHFDKTIGNLEAQDAIRCAEKLEKISTLKSPMVLETSLKDTVKTRSDSAQPASSVLTTSELLTSKNNVVDSCIPKTLPSSSKSKVPSSKSDAPTKSICSTLGEKKGRTPTKVVCEFSIEGQKLFEEVSQEEAAFDAIVQSPGKSPDSTTQNSVEIVIPDLTKDSPAAKIPEDAHGVTSTTELGMSCAPTVDVIEPKRTMHKYDKIMLIRKEDEGVSSTTVDSKVLEISSSTVEESEPVVKTHIETSPSLLMKDNLPKREIPVDIVENVPSLMQKPRDLTSGKTRDSLKSIPEAKVVCGDNICPEYDVLPPRRKIWKVKPMSQLSSPDGGGVKMFSTSVEDSNSIAKPAISEEELKKRTPLKKRQVWAVATEEPTCLKPIIDESKKEMSVSENCLDANLPTSLVDRLPHSICNILAVNSIDKSAIDCPPIEDEGKSASKRSSKKDKSVKVRMGKRNRRINKKKRNPRFRSRLNKNKVGVTIMRSTARSRHSANSKVTKKCKIPTVRCNKSGHKKLASKLIHAQTLPSKVADVDEIEPIAHGNITLEVPSSLTDLVCDKSGSVTSPPAQDEDNPTAALSSKVTCGDGVAVKCSSPITSVNSTATPALCSPPSDSKAPPNKSGDEASTQPFKELTVDTSTEINEDSPPFSPVPGYSGANHQLSPDWKKPNESTVNLTLPLNNTMQPITTPVPVAPNASGIVMPLSSYSSYPRTPMLERSQSVSNLENEENHYHSSKPKTRRESHPAPAAHSHSTTPIDLSHRRVRRYHGEIPAKVDKLDLSGEHPTFISSSGEKVMYNLRTDVIEVLRGPLFISPVKPSRSNVPIRPIPTHRMTSPVTAYPLPASLPVDQFIPTDKTNFDLYSVMNNNYSPSAFCAMKNKITNLSSVAPQPKSNSVHHNPLLYATSPANNFLFNSAGCSSVFSPMPSTSSCGTPSVSVGKQNKSNRSHKVRNDVLSNASTVRSSKVGPTMNGRVYKAPRNRKETDDRLHEAQNQLRRRNPELSITRTSHVPRKTPTSENKLEDAAQQVQSTNSGRSSLTKEIINFIYKTEGKALEPLDVVICELNEAKNESEKPPEKGRTFGGTHCSSPMKNEDLHVGGKNIAEGGRRKSKEHPQAEKAFDGCHISDEETVLSSCEVSAVIPSENEPCCEKLQPIPSTAEDTAGHSCKASAKMPTILSLEGTALSQTSPVEVSQIESKSQEEGVEPSSKPSASEREISNQLIQNGSLPSCSEKDSTPEISCSSPDLTSKKEEIIPTLHSQHCTNKDLASQTSGHGVLVEAVVANGLTAEMLSSTAEAAPCPHEAVGRLVTGSDPKISEETSNEARPCHRENKLGPPSETEPSHIEKELIPSSSSSTKSVESSTILSLVDSASNQTSLVYSGPATPTDSEANDPEVAEQKSIKLPSINDEPTQSADSDISTEVIEILDSSEGIEESVIVEEPTDIVLQEKENENLLRIEEPSCTASQNETAERGMPKKVDVSVEVEPCICEKETLLVHPPKNEDIIVESLPELSMHSPVIVGVKPEANSLGISDLPPSLEEESSLREVESLGLVRLDDTVGTKSEEVLKVGINVLTDPLATSTESLTKEESINHLISSCVEHETNPAGPSNIAPEFPRENRLLCANADDSITPKTDFDVPVSQVPCSVELVPKKPNAGEEKVEEALAQSVKSTQLSKVPTGQPRPNKISQSDEPNVEVSLPLDTVKMESPLDRSVSNVEKVAASLDVGIDTTCLNTQDVMESPNAVVENSVAVEPDKTTTPIELSKLDSVINEETKIELPSSEVVEVEIVAPVGDVPQMCTSPEAASLDVAINTTHLNAHDVVESPNATEAQSEAVKPSKITTPVEPSKVDSVTNEEAKIELSSSEVVEAEIVAPLGDLPQRCTSSEAAHPDVAIDATCLNAQDAMESPSATEAKSEAVEPPKITTPVEPSKLDSVSNKEAKIKLSSSEVVEAEVVAPLGDLPQGCTSEAAVLDVTIDNTCLDAQDVVESPSATEARSEAVEPAKITTTVEPSKLDSLSNEEAKIELSSSEVDEAEIVAPLGDLPQRCTDTTQNELIESDQAELVIEVTKNDALSVEGSGTSSSTLDFTTVVEELGNLPSSSASKIATSNDANGETETIDRATIVGLTEEIVVAEDTTTTENQPSKVTAPPEVQLSPSDEVAETQNSYKIQIESCAIEENSISPTIVEDSVDENSSSDVNPSSESNCGTPSAAEDLNVNGDKPIATNTSLKIEPIEAGPCTSDDSNFASTRLERKRRHPSWCDSDEEITEKMCKTSPTTIEESVKTPEPIPTETTLPQEVIEKGLRVDLPNVSLEPLTRSIIQQLQSCGIRIHEIDLELLRKSWMRLDNRTFPQVITVQSARTGKTNQLKEGPREEDARRNQGDSPRPSTSKDSYDEDVTQSAFSRSLLEKSENERTITTPAAVQLERSQFLSLTSNFSSEKKGQKRTNSDAFAPNVFVYKDPRVTPSTDRRPPHATVRDLKFQMVPIRSYSWILEHLREIRKKEQTNETVVAPNWKDFIRPLPESRAGHRNAYTEPSSRLNFIHSRLRADQDVFVPSHATPSSSSRIPTFTISSDSEDSNPGGADDCLNERDEVRRRIRRKSGSPPLPACSCPKTGPSSSRNACPTCRKERYHSQGAYSPVRSSRPPLFTKVNHVERHEPERVMKCAATVGGSEETVVVPDHDPDLNFIKALMTMNGRPAPSTASPTSGTWRMDFDALRSDEPPTTDGDSSLTFYDEPSSLPTVMMTLSTPAPTSSSRPPEVAPDPGAAFQRCLQQKPAPSTESPGRTVDTASNVQSDRAVLTRPPSFSMSQSTSETSLRRFRAALSSVLCQRSTTPSSPRLMGYSAVDAASPRSFHQRVPSTSVASSSPSPSTTPSEYMPLLKQICGELPSKETNELVQYLLEGPPSKKRKS